MATDSEVTEPPGVLVLVASAKLAKFALVFKFAQPVTVAIMCTAKQNITNVNL